MLTKLERNGQTVVPSQRPKRQKINAKMAKTGSGTSNVVALTPLEEKIASILGRTVKEAIKGGIDGAKTSDSNGQECSVKVTEEDEGTNNIYIIDYGRSPRPVCLWPLSNRCTKGEN